MLGKMKRCALVLLVLIWSAVSLSAQTAEVEPPFTLASLQGAYSAYADARGGAGAAGVATLTFDGAGNFSATSTWNVAGELLGPFASQGTYTVSPDGSFTLIQGDGGATGGGTGIGVITRSRQINDIRIVLEATSLGAGLGPGHNVVTSTIVRQSDD